LSLFNGQDLFSSGPHEFRVGELSLRHTLHEMPGGRGVQLNHLGRHGRSIAQAGDLVADNPDQMRIFTEAIESELDGVSHELIDEVARAWPNTVMLSFEVGPLTRAGTRWRQSYQIKYLQLTP